MLYKEILQREDLPAPLGEPPVPPRQVASQFSTTVVPICSPETPSTGTAGDTEQKVRTGFASASRLGLGNWLGWELTSAPRCPPQTLRRSSSFSKLRESIRRGSEKLVSRLRGEGMAGAAG